MENDSVYVFSEERIALVHEVMQSFFYTDRMHRQAIEARLAAFGLHRSQHRLLVHLQKSGGALSQKDLASAFDVSPAAIAVTLKKLECAGYVERCPAQADCRRKEIRLTPKGSMILDKTVRSFCEVDSLMFRDFEDGALQKISASLAAMRERLSEIPRDPVPPCNDKEEKL